MYTGNQNYILANLGETLPYNYSNPANPTTGINPPIVNMSWLNTTTSELFICTDNAVDSNVWAGNSGTTIELVPVAPLAMYSVPDSGDLKDINSVAPNLVGHNSPTATTYGYEFNPPTNTYLEGTPFTEIGGNSKITLSMFVSPQTTANDSNKQYIFCQGTGASGEMVGICLGTSNQIKLVLYGSDQYFTSSSLTAGSEYHVLVTRDDKDFELFINGVYVSSLTSSVTVNTSTSALVIGRWLSSVTEIFDGEIRSISFYDSVLSASDILFLYNYYK